MVKTVYPGGFKRSSEIPDGSPRSIHLKRSNSIVSRLFPRSQEPGARFVVQKKPFKRTKTGVDIKIRKSGERLHGQDMGEVF